LNRYVPFRTRDFKSDPFISQFPYLLLFADAKLSDECRPVRSGNVL